MSKAAAIADTFETSEELAIALARAVADLLRQAIAERGAATLAVSGGSTPRRFFEILSDEELDWSVVTVLPVDDRWVSEASERSNARLVRLNLLREWARAANFVSLVTTDETPEEGVAEIEERVSKLPQPFDVVVLGMGTDGHTASLFPGGDRLADAIDTESGKIVMPMRAEGAGEPRMTLTLLPIVSARQVFLHIEGAKKRSVFRKALAGGPADDMPVRHVLRHRDANVQVYWAP